MREGAVSLLPFRWTYRGFIAAAPRFLSLSYVCVGSTESGDVLPFKPPTIATGVFADCAS